LAQWSRARADQALAVVGDFNSAPDSGAFSEPLTVMAASGLYNSWDRVKKAERYSYRHRCRPQTLDYVWLSEALKADLQGVAVSRGNAGRYDRLYGSDGTEVVSDHDGLVTYLKNTVGPACVSSEDQGGPHGAKKKGGGRAPAPCSWRP
jgi:predicted extracellular nuclease